MQLYIVDWLFQNSEDQLFATNKFCKDLEEGKINESIEGFELNFIAHSPQDGSGVIICKVQNTEILYRVFNIWRENYSISFKFRTALTNQELLKLQGNKSF